MLYASIHPTNNLSNTYQMKKIIPSIIVIKLKKYLYQKNMIEDKEFYLITCQLGTKYGTPSLTPVSLAAKK